MPEPYPSSRYQDTDTAILRASLFLGAFALLESSIVKAVEFFYQVSDPSGEEWKKYPQEILIYADDTFESSCMWLERKRAIKPEQFSALMNFKQRRDMIHRDFSKLVLQDLGMGGKKGTQTPYLC